MQLTAIFATSENGVIGKDNKIPWRLSGDMKHFKRLTTGNSIVMGRKTFESLGKPLPNRRNIVITRQAGYQKDGIEVFHSLETALEACAEEQEVFLIGGSSVYQEALEKGLIEKIHKTLVHAEVEGDAYFDVEMDEWTIKEVDAQQADEKNEFAYTFLTLEKASKS
ncbi:MAG: dihydrofolate reductase [Bacteroidota bacterium]